MRVATADSNAAMALARPWRADKHEPAAPARFAGGVSTLNSETAEFVSPTIEARVATRFFFPRLESPPPRIEVSSRPVPFDSRAIGVTRVAKLVSMLRW